MKIYAFFGRYQVVQPQFKITFKCCVCKQEVTPEQLILGKAHVYALHCGQMQDVGIVIFTPERTIVDG